MSIRIVLLGILGFCCAASRAHAGTWYVDAKANAAGDGRSPAGAFPTIQQAADAAGPGDVVVIAPGVYFENVTLRNRGLPDRPIIFRADRIEKHRVVVTGADRDLRTGRTRWILDDAALGLYSIPWDKPRPTRVLYGETDLYPYAGLEQLKRFMSSLDVKRPAAGPRHGYFWDGKNRRLHVRLYAEGKYGPSDPNQQTLCVSGPLGGGSVGLEVTQPAHYTLGLPGSGDAHVVIEGLTFETPGVFGVYTEANEVTVRDCWFFGCRAGVGGNAPYDRPETFSYANTANRVVVERCLWTQFPLYEDGLETLAAGSHFWHRKDISGGLPDALLNYEVGIAALMGRDWTVRHCRIESAFDGLSSRATTNSDNARIHDNVFERLLDNAIESEDHSTNLRFYRNLVVDVFVPLSWQPLEGEPWPTGFRCYQNVIYNRPAHREAFAFRNPPVFKIGATEARKRYGKEYLPKLGEPGLLFYNNTILWERGCLFWGALWGNHPDKVGFFNNIILTDLNLPADRARRAPGLELTFRNNLLAQTALPGFEDQMATGAEALGLRDLAAPDPWPRDGSPALGRAGEVPGGDGVFKDIGALQRGDGWFPPKAGPAVSR